MDRTDPGRRSDLTAPSDPASAIEVRQEVHIGPLPSADEFRKYESTLPGVADRIVRLAEGHAADHWRNHRNRRLSTILLPAIAGRSGLGDPLSLIPCR